MVSVIKVLRSSATKSRFAANNCTIIVLVFYLNAVLFFSLTFLYVYKFINVQQQLLLSKVFTVCYTSQDNRDCHTTKSHDLYLSQFSFRTEPTLNSWHCTFLKAILQFF